MGSIRTKARCELEAWAEEREGRDRSGRRNPSDSWSKRSKRGSKAGDAGDR